MFSENDIALFLPYILMAGGLGVMLYAFFKKALTATLIEKGRKAEGIIFEMKGKSSGDSTSFGGIVYDKIIVRFITDKLEWVTAEAKNEFGMFYSGQYKIGENVEVLYDAEDPEQFIIITKQSEHKARLVGIIAGLVLLIAGIYKLFA